MKDSSVDMVLMGTFEQDDITILRELGFVNSKNRLFRINFIVDKLIFHQFGNYVL
jgi:hypothetical protein